LLPEGGLHVMFSPNKAVDGLTWREVTGPGTMDEEETVNSGEYLACQLMELVNRLAQYIGM
jgi:hypothetical protein